MSVPMQPVRDVAGTIFESVCHLKVIRRRGLSRAVKNSSAALYRGRYLITAAHNVHSNAFSSVRLIRVSCGTAAFSEDSVDDEVGRDAVWVPSGYSFVRPLPGRHRTDYAVVRLNRPIAAARTFGLDELGGAPPFPLSVAGYPGDEDDTTPQDAEHLYVGRGTATGIEDYLLHYDVDTSKGVSGAPVWIERDSGPTIVGIHVGGTSEYARARVISGAVRREIEAAINAFGD
jgi:hypothetical protein